MFVFAQIHVDPRGKRPAEYVVHGLDGKLVRIVLRRRDLCRDDHALLRIRPVHDEHPLGGLRLHRADVLVRNVLRLPAREQGLEFWLHLGEARIADDYHRGIVRPEPRVMEADQIAARDARHGLLGAGTRQRHVVSMARTVDQSRHESDGQLHRRVLLCLDAGRDLLPDPREFALRELRVHDHVREDVERCVEVLLEAVERDDRLIDVRAGLQRRAERGQLVADLE